MSRYPVQQETEAQSCPSDTTPSDMKPNKLSASSFHTATTNPSDMKPKSNTTILLEVNAAYNRGGLPMPKPNGPNGRRVLNLEMLMNHPFYWEWLNERETEEVLMEIYIARTRRAQ